MCQTIPMRVEEIDANRARCAAMGHEKWADLMLVASDPPKVGDYVVIHLGFVQRTVPEEEALQSHALFEEIAETLARES